MGNNMFNSLFKGLWKGKEVRILIVGLDAAGKTTLLYKMKLGEIVTTIPTIGFNVETIQYKNINMTAWDVGGRGGGLRGLWRHYYQNTQAVMFVVDSNDRERIEEAKESMDKMMKEDELAGVPFLVYANKQDLPNAMKIAEITDKLGLHSIKDREWYIEGSCMTSGDGIYEGLDWLTNVIQKGFENPKPTTKNISNLAKNVQPAATGDANTASKKRWWLF